MSRPRPWIADLALAAVALIWGATFVIVKRALETTSALLFLALRFGLASLALAAVFRCRRGGLPVRRHELKAGVITGLVLFAGYVLQTVGLHRTTPSNSAFITGLYIVLVPLLGAVAWRKAPLAVEWLGVAVAAAGMGVLTLEPGSLTMGAGDLLTLGCAFAFAVHILLVGRYSRQTSVETYTLLQVATSALVAGAVFWWAEPLRVQWGAGLAAAVGVTALLATALAFTVQTWAQRHTTPTHTALMFTLEPVFAWVTSLAVSAERFSLRSGASAALILAGILLVELKPSGAAKHPSDQADR